MNPLVTIAIPVFNGAEHVKVSLESAISQTYENLEIFVVDNASKDETLSVCKLITDPRITIIEREQTIEMWANWNTCLSLGSGKYLKLLCHDDILRSDCIERQVALFEEFSLSNVCIATSRKTLIDSNGKDLKISIGLNEAKLGKIISGHKVIRRTCRSGRNIVGEVSSVLIDRSKVGSLRFDDSKAALDLQFWIDLLQDGNLGVINDALVKYRISGNSQSSQLSKVQAGEFRQLLKRNRQNLSLKISRADQFLGILNSWYVVKFRRLLTFLVNVRSDYLH